MGRGLMPGEAIWNEAWALGRGEQSNGAGVGLSLPENCRRGSMSPVAKYRFRDTLRLMSMSRKCGSAAEQEAVMKSARGGGHQSLWELSHESPLLVIFLRHLGCTFCKEAVQDAAKQRADIQAAGARIVFVHMASEVDAAAFFDGYGMADVERISDPEGRLYRAFGLERAGIKEILSPSVWTRGISAILSGNVPGIPRGDLLRMPGAFVVNQGRVTKSYFHRTIAARPDLTGMSKEGLAACRL